MKTKQLECIFRLIQLGALEEIKEYLIESNLVKEEDFFNLSRDTEIASFIYDTLQLAVSSKHLQLLDFEWSLLPLELIRVTCVTDTEKKEFTHGL